MLTNLFHMSWRTRKKDKSMTPKLNFLEKIYINYLLNSPIIMQKGLGEELGNFVLYNCISNKINRSAYNGCRVVGAKLIQKQMPEFQEVFAQNHAFDGRVPVAIVAKTTFKDGSYCYRGFSIAGNVVFYAPKTSGLSLLSNKCFFTGGRYCGVAASEEALYQTFNYIMKNRQDLINIIKQQNK